MSNVVNFKELAVDKENEFVSYNDELHKYWTKDTQQACISVTTLIHHYNNFDEDFWANYKALERVDAEAFKSIRGKLNKTRRFDDSCLEDLGITKEDFMRAKTEILSEWAAKRDESCKRGTIIHREHELGHLSGETPEIKQLGLGGKFNSNTTNKITLGEQTVYPELLLSWCSEDGELRLAGQADLIIIDGKKLFCLDYKTNKSIDQKSYFNQKTKKSEMMKYPLNNIQDSNFWHYSLQLSTYVWMLQKAYPELEVEKLILIHYDHDNNRTLYECDYLKDDVEKMLSHYKKELKYDKFKKNLEKVIF